ncbi:hypothetical protein FRC09_010903 [Ceratobasidium sp. 395]|nr:hypothetical protein FRC09_010903 [Ceratobasidium sp. 395]
MNSGTSISSSSPTAAHGDEAMRSIQSSFRHEDDTHFDPPTRQPSPLHGASSANSSSMDSVNGTGETPTCDKPTKRDKLAGKVGKVVAKITHDPELHDRAMLREIGGKELADGLTMVDSSTL